MYWMKERRGCVPSSHHGATPDAGLNTLLMCDLFSAGRPPPLFPKQKHKQNRRPPRRLPHVRTTRDVHDRSCSRLGTQVAHTQRDLWRRACAVRSRKIDPTWKRAISTTRRSECAVLWTSENRLFLNYQNVKTLTDHARLYVFCVCLCRRRCADGYFWSCVSCMYLHQRIVGIYLSQWPNK